MIIVLLVPIPIWLIVLILPVLIGLSGMKIADFIKQARTPGWTKYKTDTIEGIYWNWRWNREGQQISDLIALCPDCSSELVEQISSIAGWGEISGYLCENCSTSKGAERTFEVGDHTPVEDRIMREIRRRVNTGDYLKKIQST